MSSAYPMKFVSISMDHSAGTKSYQIVLVTTADGRSLHLNKWGKKGAFGELQTFTFDTISGGNKSFKKKESSRISGGYSQSGPVRELTLNNAKDLKDAFGLPIWAKMGKDAINHLDPDIDTSGMRDAEPNRVGEDGKLTGDDKPRTVDIAADVEAEKARLAAESAAVLRKNPNFGRFA